MEIKEGDIFTPVREENKKFKIKIISESQKGDFFNFVYLHFVWHGGILRGDIERNYTKDTAIRTQLTLF